MSMAYRNPSGKATTAAVDAFNEAIKSDPSNVDAHFQLGTYLLSLRRTAEAYPHLKQALSLSPHAVRVHSAYWRAVLALPGATAEKKQSDVETDINSLLERRSDYPETLFRIASQYQSLKLNDKRRDMEDRILKSYAMSKEAEWVLVNRYRDFREEIGTDIKKDVKKRDAYRGMLWAFINRPSHHYKALLGDAYIQLFFSTDKDDPTVSDVELLKIINGMIQYETRNVQVSFAAGAIALADRNAYLDKAEGMAREGINRGKKRIDGDRPGYETEGDYQRALDVMTGIMRDALGWVIFRAGRTAEAETELLKARELYPENVTILSHLGQFYEAQGKLDSAEEFYIKGVMVKIPRENPNAAALKALYEKRHGGLAGYEEYLSKIAELDRAKRMDAVLKARMGAPKQVEPFDLATLSGGSLSFEKLRGKVTVVNFWGVWCGWCVQEMPDFQKLSDKYKGDPNVAILTIDNDANPEDVRAWLQKHGYNFNVLLDNGYVNKTGVRAFPTTWFIDKDGRIAFVKKGWSEKLVEEFSWRIEALRSSEQPKADIQSNADEQSQAKNINQEPFTIIARVEPQPALPNSRVELVVKIEIAPGYHINANKPDDEYLIPTSLTGTPVIGIDWKTAIYPAAVTVLKAFSSKPLKVYSGEVVIKLPFVIAPTAVTGGLTINAELRVQACNNESCFPPRKIPILAKVTIDKTVKVGYLTRGESNVRLLRSERPHTAEGRSVERTSRLSPLNRRV